MAVSRQIADQPGDPQILVAVNRDDAAHGVLVAEELARSGLGQDQAARVGQRCLGRPGDKLEIENVEKARFGKADRLVKNLVADPDQIFPIIEPGGYLSRRHHFANQGCDGCMHGDVCFDTGFPCRIDGCGQDVDAIGPGKERVVGVFVISNQLRQYINQQPNRQSQDIYGREQAVFQDVAVGANNIVFEHFFLPGLTPLS